MNKTIPKIFKNRTSYHLLFWFFFFIGLLIVNYRYNTFEQIFFWTTSILVFISIPVYINFFFLKKLFNKNKYASYFAIVFITVVICSFGMDFYFTRVFNDETNIFNDVLSITFFVIMTTAIKFSKKSFEQKIELEKIKNAKIAAELQYLKMQLNPHFLFNTLNNLYSLSLKNDEKTSIGIIKLSNLMRYLIYESDSEIIELNREIEQIQNLIELQKLRLADDDAVKIEFNIENERENIQIAPMILIPFVENAFKHGIKINENSFIKIDLKIMDDIMDYKVINSIHSHTFESIKSKTGLGLQNIKRRLEIIYPGSYTLSIKNNNEIFSVELKINL